MDKYFLEDFYNGLELAENTRKTYKRDVKQFLKFYKGELNDIKPSHIKRYINYLKDYEYTKGKGKNQIKSKLGASTINRKLSAIEAYFKFILEDYPELKNLNMRIKKLKVQKRENLENLLTKAEFDRLANKAIERKDTKTVAILYTLFFTGVRISELIKLNVNQFIDYSTGEIKKYIDVIGKGSKERNIRIPTLLYTEFLKPYIDEYDIKPGEYLFKSPVKEKSHITRGSINYVLKKYVGFVRGGLKKEKVTPHKFRHLYCKHLLESGFDISQVKQLAGHSLLETTAIYTKRTIEEIDEDINKLFIKESRKI